MIISDMIWTGITLLALYIGGNTYLFIRLWQLVVQQPLWLRIGFILLFAVVATSLFVSLALRNANLPTPLAQVLFGIGSAWLVFLLYAVMLLIVADVIKLLCPTFQYGTFYALGATLLLLVFGYINYRNPRVEHLEITTDKSLDRDNYRIVMASDIHLGYGTTRRDLARYIELINSQQPDVVVIAGDLIDNSIKPVAEGDMCEEFNHVTARDGVYMCAGNHEYISGIDAVEEYLSTSCVHLLRDDVARLSSGISIIGRDDRMNRNRMPLEELATQCEEQDFVVVLDHQPKSVMRDADASFNEMMKVASHSDLHLSGHTHRGQIWPLSWLTDAMYAQSHGYRKWGDSCHVVVSSGLSLWGPPFRIGTQSEIWVIDIKRQ